MDILFIEDLRLPTFVGIYPREKARMQTVELSLQIGTSIVKASAGDTIQDTIDYSKVVDCLRAELGARHFNLLETLAEFVARLLIERYGACWVRVSVAKLGALQDARRVGVVIERSAESASS